MKIICIGRNYSDHAKELKNEVPTKPLWFMKPDSALLLKNKPLYYPEFTKDLHYETELVFRIHKAGKYIEEKYADKYYDAIAIGFDFTARDLQAEAQKKGTPWEIAKAFDSSAALSEFIPIEEFRDLNDINFSMKRNGMMVQKGNSSEMIFSIEKIISYVSRFVTLKIGDLIYTGTPAGVGPVEIGDFLEAYIEGKLLLKTEIK
ncbi:MAG: fumarylacetoacetate hydrolase family protein [Bacteroidales bacterium]|nr:fumarylacetoacetate hydrolase family protein [Bacteroidales bacterium]